MHRVVLIVLLASLGACETPESTREAPPAGTMVESNAPMWSPTTAWRFQSVPEVTVGEADGGAEYALSEVVGAVRMADGVIVIANRGTNELRYYDADGRHVRTAGRSGGGPGEFRRLDAIGTVGDTILVWDTAAQRVSRFPRSGIFETSVSLADFDVPLPVLIGFLGDGSMLVRPRVTLDKRGSPEGEYADSLTYFRFSSRTGKSLTKLGPYFGAEMYLAVANRNAQGSPVIFGNRSFAATASNGFYRAESDGFQATFFAPDGTPVRTVRRPYAPVRATRADIAAEREKLEQGDQELLEMAPDMAPVRRRLLDNLPHRSTLPAISQLRVDREDNLWIQAYTRPDAESAEWSVFDPEGHWLGVVSIPTHLEVLEIGDDYLLAKTVDPLDDVERVVLHRLRKPR